MDWFIMMKKNKKNPRYLAGVLGILLAILLIPKTVFPTEKSLWPDKVKVGGEFRFRLESNINYQFITPTPVTDTYYLTRTRVYLDLNPQDNVRLFGMFQDSETFDQSATTLIQTPDRHKFYQGWVYLKNKAPVTTSVKMGRQELIYGDQRLVGNFDWGNLARSFDGAVIRVENPDFWLDLFGTRIHPNVNEFQFAGAYGHWKKFPQGELEPYVLVLHSSTAGLGSGDLGIVTIGSRIVGKFKKNYDYGFEGAYQTGKNAGNLVSAFATHFRLGYTFSPSWKPRIGIEYNFASGDKNPGTGTVTTFNNLFPTNHDKYGYMDLFAWRNLHDIRANVSVAPTSFMTASADYHAFFLPDPENGTFLFNGTQLRAGAPGASDFAGQELDFLIKFKPPTKYFDGLIGYSVFFPGGFYNDTGGAHTAQFFYTQVTARY